MTHQLAVCRTYSMSVFDHIRAVSEHDKSVAVKKLIETSTPNFDFFFLVILSVLMATFGLLENSPAVVIGSMLVAPILFPILSLSLSIVMSDYKLISRATTTLFKALVLGVAAAFFAALFFGGADAITPEVLQRTAPTLVSIAIAVVAGFAVAYTLVRPGLSATLPGIAVAVALIPPLAAMGVGLASFNWAVVVGATLFLTVNVVGIIFASMLVFSLMNLYVKRHIAEKTADTADMQVEKEAEKIKEISEKEKESKEEEKSS